MGLAVPFGTSQSIRGYSSGSASKPQAGCSRFVGWVARAKSVTMVKTPNTSA
jgi:hypothetical protein